MIETRVRIVSVAEGTAMVTPIEQSGCGACHARSACGIGGLGRYLQTGRRPIPVACNGSARAGDDLVVAVSEADLVKAGLLAYVLPVVLAVLGAGSATGLGHGDAGAALGMLSGCAVGLLYARFLGRASPLVARHPNDPKLQGDAP